MKLKCTSILWVFRQSKFFHFFQAVCVYDTPACMNKLPETSSWNLHQTLSRLLCFNTLVLSRRTNMLDFINTLFHIHSHIHSHVWAAICRPNVPIWADSGPTVVILTAGSLLQRNFTASAWLQSRKNIHYSFNNRSNQPLASFDEEFSSLASVVLLAERRELKK